MLPLSLAAPVGPDRDNDEEDVKAVATNLWSLGFPEAQSAAETGQWDGGIENGLREYQRVRSLAVDGWAGPGGETERSLNGEAAGDNQGARDAGATARAPSLSAYASPRSRDAGAGFLERFMTPRGSEAERAGAAHEGLLDRGDPAAPLRGAEESLFARNAITGQPLRLKPPVTPQGEIDPPAPPALEDVERILTNRGYRYRPDPMGRLGEGDWLDEAGKALDPGARQQIVNDGSSSASGGDFVEYVRQTLGLPTRAAAFDALEQEEAAGASAETIQDDGGSRNWRGLFRSGRGAIVGGPQGMPPELAARLAHIKDSSVRGPIERLLQGSAVEKGMGRHPHQAYNVYKPGSTSTGFREFHETVRRMGGTKDDIRPDGPGRWIFTATDGTRLIFRRRVEAEKKQATNEIHIERSGHELARIKIRYDD